MIILRLITVFLCLICFVRSDDQVEQMAVEKEEEVAQITVQQNTTEPEEEAHLYKHTLDHLEVKIISEKVDLMKRRLQYLKNKRDQIEGLGEVDFECLESHVIPADEELEKEYHRANNATKKRNEVTHKQFQTQIIRVNLNSLTMKNQPFFERAYIYSSADAIGNPTDIVWYDYMHIRMKPQSTKFQRASATANSIPKYVLVVIESNNVLRIYDTSKRALALNENPTVLMTIDLLAEGILAADVILLEAMKSPHNSYRRDNSDLRPEDVPGFALFLRNGTAVSFQVNVIDKASGLGAWKTKHPHDVRYILPSQTPNPPKKRDANNSTKSSYTKPEIRIDKIQFHDLRYLATANQTSEQDKAQVGDVSYVSAKAVTVRSRKYLQALDTRGYMNYFLTKNYKSFQYTGRYDTGGNPLAQVDGKTNSAQITAIQDYGTFGFFIQYQNHFVYSRHMQLKPEFSSVCLSGIQDQSGLRLVAPDQGISGLLYALPTKGDRILMFQVNAQQGAMVQQRPGRQNKQAPGRQKPGFQASSQCELVGNLRFPNIDKIENGHDRIIQLQSIKGQLIVQTEQGSLYSMETSSLEQIILYPYLTEITPTINRLTSASNTPHQKLQNQVGPSFPILTLRKSSGETNDQKGSTNLVLIPHRYMEDNQQKTALYSIDYAPIKSRSVVKRNLNEVIEKKETGYQYKLASEKQLSIDFNLDDKKEKSPLWKVLNYILGFSAFGLIAYFMIQVKKSKSGGGPGAVSSRGGGMFGGKGPGGKGKSMFGGGRGKGFPASSGRRR